MRAVGVAAESPELVNAIEAVKKFWSQRFFASQYLKYDRPYPGAAEFTRKLHALGAEIVYLTGRDEPGMGDGTRSVLLRDGFPWEVERTHLLMKKAAPLSDLEHKKEAAHYIRKHGQLVASFENEPPNLVALSELFPEAMHVFVDTICSDHPAPAAQRAFIGSRVSRATPDQVEVNLPLRILLRGSAVALPACSAPASQPLRILLQGRAVVSGLLGSCLTVPTRGS